MTKKFLYRKSALTQETVDKSADFFQWALGGNFTAQEMDEYRSSLCVSGERKIRARLT
jgi:hypothetical protein